MRQILKTIKRVVEVVIFGGMALVTFTTANAANAETFSIAGFALNTNINIRRFDGFPEVIPWQLISTDPDMNFIKAPSKIAGTFTLQNQTTNGCLNSHYGINSRTNAWYPCDSNDPDMAWKIVTQNGGYWLQNYRSGLCLTMPTAKANYGIISMQSCSSTNPNQIWTIANTTTPPPSSSDVIIKRAKSWVDRSIPYSQTAPYFEGYRQDCSGFVSMAWQLPTSPDTTTLPTYSTTLSSKDQLLPGDAINNRRPLNDGHVVLFVRWTDKAQGKFVAYEENGYYHKALQTNLTLDVTANGFNVREYSPSSIPGPWYLERRK